MNKLFIMNILATSLISIPAFANHSFSLGYSQAKVDQSENLKGVQAQYRYSFNSPLSLIVSTSLLTSKDREKYNDGHDDYENDVKVRYISLMVGPEYRFNQYISAYTTVGFANTKLNGDQTWINSTGHIKDYKVSESKTNLAYGVGVVINPFEQLSVSLGHEVAKISTGTDYNGDVAVRGYSIGIGYRF